MLSQIERTGASMTRPLPRWSSRPANRSGKSHAELDGPVSHSRLERRALLLMTATGANAILGIVFWMVAARVYSPTDVGRGSAILSAATILATLSRLNLDNVYARFLAFAGHRQRSLVFIGYGAIGGLSLLLGAAYSWLGPGTVLFGSALEAWLFPLGVALLAVFALQDMILVCVQRAGWVPIENIAWGLAKLVALILIASSLPTNGIELAWVLPTVAAVTAVSTYLGFRPWPWGSADAAALPGRSDLAKAVSSEYLNGLDSAVAPLVLPLLVVQRLGLDANAYFAMPWLLATALNLLMWNIASIFLVDASREPNSLPNLLGRALRLSLIVAVASGAFVILAGPWLLSILGPAYAANGVWLLRVAALASPAVAVIIVWCAASRSLGKLRRVVVMQAAIGVSVVGLAFLLIGSIGVVGIGIAYLLANTTAALIVLRPLLGTIRSGSVDGSIGRHRSDVGTPGSSNSRRPSRRYGNQAPALEDPLPGSVRPSSRSRSP